MGLDEIAVGGGFLMAEKLEPLMKFNFATTPLQLLGRTFYRAIRTEDAAVFRLDGEWLG